MKLEQWNTLQRCAQLEAIDPLPLSLIVDSPWTPGYLDISMLDYFTMPEIWLDANLRVMEAYPEIIFLPGFWVEYGMGIEPSGFGSKVKFPAKSTPMVHTVIDSVEDVDRLEVPNPRTDGLMPFALNLYANLEPRVNDAGRLIKIVAARGPMATASHLMGVTEFMLALGDDSENIHKLMRMATDTTKHWLEAQADVLSDVEGILVLDDIVGFLGPDDFLEFGHPYFSEIFSAFPEALKIFHNDMDNPISFEYLRHWPVDIFNFSHKIVLSETRKRVGPDICLMGNVPPLEAMAHGTPEDVRQATRACLQDHPGREGLLLSVGGGTSPGTPGENIRAFIQAAREGEI